MFHFRERGHLGRRSIDDLFNVGNTECKKNYRVGDGLDVVFKCALHLHTRDR